jgi:hypothetical protein
MVVTRAPFSQCLHNHWASRRDKGAFSALAGIRIKIKQDTTIKIKIGFSFSDDGAFFACAQSPGAKSQCSIGTGLKKESTQQSK